MVWYLYIFKNSKIHCSNQSVYLVADFLVQAHQTPNFMHVSCGCERKYIILAFSEQIICISVREYGVGRGLDSKISIFQFRGVEILELITHTSSPQKSHIKFNNSVNIQLTIKKLQTSVVHTAVVTCYKSAFFVIFNILNIYVMLFMKYCNLVLLQ